MTNKEFIERLKGNDWIYETDENGNVVITKTAGEIFKNHFKKLEKDLEILEIFKNNHHLVIHKDDNTFILSFNVNVNEIDDFKEWLENDK